MTTADLKTYLTAAVESFTNGKASTDTTLNGQTLYANIKDDISHLLATNWFASKELAQGTTKGGSAAGDFYLATITTIHSGKLPDHAQWSADSMGRRPGIRRIEQKRFHQQR